MGVHDTDRRSRPGTDHGRAVAHPPSARAGPDHVENGSGPADPRGPGVPNQLRGKLLPGDCPRRQRGVGHVDGIAERQREGAVQHRPRHRRHGGTGCRPGHLRRRQSGAMHLHQLPATGFRRSRPGDVHRRREQAGRAARCRDQPEQHCRRQVTDHRISDQQRCHRAHCGPVSGHRIEFIDVCGAQVHPRHDAGQLAGAQGAANAIVRKALGQQICTAQQRCGRGRCVGRSGHAGTVSLLVQAWIGHGWGCGQPPATSPDRGAARLTSPQPRDVVHQQPARVVIDPLRAPLDGTARQTVAPRPTRT